jgi:hypothetical protein
MPDMESVITHLQIIHTWAEFARERDLQFFTLKHLEDIAQWSSDAIVMIEEQKQMYFTLEHDWRMCTKLLKEQEAVKPIRKLAYTKQGWFCGNCDNRLNRNGKYCSFCGKPVLWEGR